MMVPTSEGPGPGFKDREHRPGYRLSNKKVRDKLEDYDGYGIYEWSAKRNRRGAKRKVVYVGSTCRSKRGSLSKRILEYCRNGSHKARKIDDALQRKYELWVRVKSSANKKEAEKEENELLEQYNYAWNKRNNGKMRNIL